MEDIIKNPINYSGSKSRILDLIKPNLPQDCTTIIEPFGGTFEVALNTKFDKKIYNDKNQYLYSLIEMLKRRNISDILQYLETAINQWGLSKYDKANFYKFRDDFNKSWAIYLKLDIPVSNYKDIALIRLLALIYHSFNYFITFDKDGNYINTSGYNRSWFNPYLRQKLIKYQRALKDMVTEMHNMDFSEFYFNLLAREKRIRDKDCENPLKGTFWFIDPPYVNSDDTYSRTSGLKWTTKNEEDLYSMCDSIDKHGGKFMLTNTIECNGKKNELLIEFSKKYNTINTDCDFYGCSYQRKNSKTKEIIVKNY